LAWGGGGGGNGGAVGVWAKIVRWRGPLTERRWDMGKRRTPSLVGVFGGEGVEFDILGVVVGMEVEGTSSIKDDISYMILAHQTACACD